MLQPEDFTLPIEKELRICVIKKEVEECNDIEALKKNLLTCAESLMRFQHLTTKLVERQIHNNMNLLLTTMDIETAEM